MKSYNEMCKYKTLNERFNYLKLNSSLFEKTFGYERYMNQRFYSSYDWKKIRNYIILRDGGCELGIPGLEIRDKIYIHHINPISPKDMIKNPSRVLDPNNLICVSDEMHRAIHYGNIDLIKKDFIERKPNDTCPWKG